jgi:hypothetical protein
MRHLELEIEPRLENFFSLSLIQASQDSLDPLPKSFFEHI